MTTGADTGDRIAAEYHVWAGYGIAVAVNFGRFRPWLGDELVADVQFALWKFLHDGGRPSPPLVATVCRRAATEVVRRHCRAVRGLDPDADPDRVPRDDPAGVRREAALDLDIMLAGLAPDRRRAVELLFLEGLSPTAAGKRLRTTAPAVVALAEAGLKSLRDRYGGPGGHAGDGVGTDHRPGG